MAWLAVRIPHGSVGSTCANLANTGCQNCTLAGHELHPLEMWAAAYSGRVDHTMDDSATGRGLAAVEEPIVGCTLDLHRPQATRGRAANPR